MNLPSYLQREKSGSWLLRLRVQPKASKTGWAGAHGDLLKVRVSAPPVDGKANLELVGFLTKTLRLSPGRIQMVAGRTSRDKTIRIDEITLEDLLSRLPSG